MRATPLSDGLDSCIPVRGLQSDPDSTCCHSFRATGITAILENVGTIENAQAIAAHESPRSTKLYHRTSDEITLDEI